MFGWFSGKKEVERVKVETKRGFDSIKEDIHSVGKWITHLDSEKELHKKDIDDLKAILSMMQKDIGELKNSISSLNEMPPKHLFKTPNQVFNKQTGVYAVQTGVQTGVQTPKLDQFSISEKGILWVLLNTDLKLSYDDIAAVLGKERSTIRGQINSIKQKGGEIIKEVSEKNGKKRIFIPEEIKEKLLKKVKVKIKERGSKK